MHVHEPVKLHLGVKFTLKLIELCQILLTEKCDPKVCCSVSPWGGATLKVGLQVPIRGVNYRPVP